MPYIGNTPALDYISYAVQNFTVTAGTTVYTLDYSVANENDIALYINSVAQRPGASFAYSATGTTLTLTSATLATDTMYAVFIGRAVQTVTPPASSITNTMLSPSVITGQTAVTTPATDDVLLCYDTSATALRKITFANFGNAPAFQVKLTSDQTISDAVATKIQFNSELFDTNSAYDSTTNYRFTVPSGYDGKYTFYLCVTHDADGSGGGKYNSSALELHKNGVAVIAGSTFHDGQFLFYNQSIIYTDNALGGDYYEAFLYVDNNNASSPKIYSGTSSVFGAYRLIGV